MENNNYQIGDIMDNRYLADINNNPYDQIINTITKRRLVVRVPFGRNPARGQLSRMYNSFHNIKDKKMYSGMKDLFY
uniref:Doublecortin domain-containing protein n=1 Tax=Parastrongyloides trichosuri TaxID=131310 RepID=A0A0N5A3L3_PARTI